MATYKLTYFPGRGGAEVIRLALSAAGQEFEDERVTMEKWPERRDSMPMKALPVLEVTENGKSTVYCQSGSCAKYIGKKYGLVGSTPEEELLIDEVFESVMDTTREVWKIFFEKDEEKKKTMKEKFETEAIPKLCEYVQKRQATYGKDGFIIGSKLSLADIQVFNLVDQSSRGGYGPCWDKYPDIRKIEQFVKGQKNIGAWLDKRPESEF